MTLREIIVEIKYLVSQGVSKVEVAHRCGVSRQTVYNLLKSRELGSCWRAPRRSKLDPFKAYIRARLEKFDLPATTLIRELRAQDYRGGLSILRQYMAPLKAEYTRRVTERFETLPGQQAQIDWGECGTVEVNGQQRKLYVFVMVLGYSRMMYARFTTSTRIPVLLDCLVRAFDRLGIPAELLVDNMKQAVDRHDVTTGVIRWNPTFLDFVHHHGTHPLACPPYWPRVKGKVERGVGYVKTSFLEGRCFTDVDDLNRQLEHWLDTEANVRIHGTTKRRPVDRFAADQAAMHPLAAVPWYDVRPIEYRQVPPDCHISYYSVPYSVHPDAVGRTVVVRPDGEQVGDAFTVYLGDRVVARHRRQPQHSLRVTLPEHEAAIRHQARGTVRARRRTPRYEHQPTAPPPTTHPGVTDAVAVQQRCLQAYEAVAS